MKIKVRINTPKGNAMGISKKLRLFLLPIGVSPKTETNEDDSQIVWTIEGDPRKVMKVNRNVAMFDTTIKTIYSGKLFRKAARRAVGEEGLDELDNMLKNHTTCEIMHE